MSDVIFFSSPIGLGHAARDIAIAQNLGNLSLKFVSGQAASNLLTEYGYDSENVYSPPMFDVKNGSLQNPIRWLFKYYSYYRDCKAISSRIIEKEKARLIVSDEDFASLSIAQKKNLKTVLITDILKTNFVSGFGSLIEKMMNHSMRNIIKKCDSVIIPENGLSEKNIVRVGPIVRSTSYSREELRKKFSFNKKTIVVSVGGTSAGHFLINRVIEVVKNLKIDAELVIVSGPSLEISDKNFRNLGFVSNLHEVIYASDLVISLAGKSTVDESKHYGTPGIFIPIKGHFEQEKNAKETGFSYDDLFHLDSLIPIKLNEKRDPAIINGAQKAADLIKSLL